MTALIAKAMVLGFGIILSLNAHGSRVHDLTCLTADFVGSDNNLAEYINATQEAAQTFGIAPAILVAIKRTESGRSLNPYVVNNNTNGTIDRGYYQVNADVWLPELRRIGLKISGDDLHDVRNNALIAAWIYKRKLNRVHSPLEAVGYYHKGGGSGPQAERIRSVYKNKFMENLRASIKNCS